MCTLFLQLGKKNFGVRPVFASIDKVNMLVDKAEGVNKVPSMYSRKQAPDLPTWIMYDKNVSIKKFELVLETS